MDKKLKKNCYVCGKLIEELFMIVSPRSNTDRVFLIHIECGKRIETGQYICECKEVKK
jgi:predicted nucleic acid-binding Zn ribbon protein